jgi:glycosyltransferase involved in cell wall biosynthesis
MTEPNLMKEPKRIIYVGMVTSDQEAEKYKEYSIAGNNLQNKFIRVSEPDGLINIKPLTLTDRASDLTDYSFNLVELMRGIVKVFRYLVMETTTIYKLYRSIKKQSYPIVIFYNVDYYNFLLILLAILLKSKVIIIAADYVSPPRVFLDKLYLVLYQQADGVIKLRNNNDFLGKNLVLTAIVDPSHGVDCLQIDAKNVLYSGSIGYTTGLAVVIEAACKLPEATFNICGPLFDLSTEEFYKAIKVANSSGANIKYHGVLQNEEYLKLLQRCEIALSMRNPEDPDHSNNFPSKIADYFNNSRCVVSSIAYEELSKEAYELSGFTGGDLSKVIRTLFNDKSLMLAYSKKGYEFAQQEFSLNVSRRKLRRFINAI